MAPSLLKPVSTLSGQSSATQGSLPVAPVNGAGAVAGGRGGAAVPITTAGQPLPQSISAQALLTLIQTLGKPLGGTVLSPGSIQGATPQSLPLSLNGPQPQTGGTPMQLQAVLELPPGTQAPRAGSPVVVNASSAGPSNQVPASTLSVTITGSPPADINARSEHAARQSSLAPLLADLMRMPSATKLPPGVDTAIQRLLGLSLNGTRDGDVNARTLRASVEAVLGSSVRSGPTATGTSTGAGTPTTMNNALAALVRALGILQTQPTGETAKSASSSNTAATAQENGGAKPNPTPLPSQHGNQPSRLAAHPLPVDTPDLADPAVLQALKGKAEAAQSRQLLMQSPDPTNIGRGVESQHAMRADIPLMLGQEAAILGIAIDQENEGGVGGSGSARTWRFRFAVESNAHGGIEGLIALHQNPQTSAEPPQVDVAVWASDPNMFAALKASQPALINTFGEMDITLTSLTVGHLGETVVHNTRAPKASVGSSLAQQSHYLDRSS